MVETGHNTYQHCSPTTYRHANSDRRTANFCPNNQLSTQCSPAALSVEPLRSSGTVCHSPSKRHRLSEHFSTTNKNFSVFQQHRHRLTVTGAHTSDYFDVWRATNAAYLLLTYSRSKHGIMTFQVRVHLMFCRSSGKD